MEDKRTSLEKIASAAERSGDYVSAFDAWRELASSFSRPDYLSKLGRTAQKLGRWTEAENAFLDAIAIDETFCLGMILLGSLFLKRKDGDTRANVQRAKEWIERALVIAPNPTSLSLLGDAHNRLGDKAAAKQAFSRAVELDDSYAEAYFNLGLLLAEEGNNEKAESFLRKATQLDPNSHEGHGQLGIVLQRLGKTSESEAELRRALEIDPTDAVAGRHLSPIAGGNPSLQ
jgi:protein O-GlcNAc transferase